YALYRRASAITIWTLMKSLAAITPPSYNPYYLLRVYTYYRTLLGSALLLMFQSNIAPNVFGSDNRDLFLYTSSIYTIVNFITLIALWRVRFLPSQKYLFALLLIDLVAISLLIHSSGGVTNGLGYLILIAVAAGGILLRGQIAIFFASLACIAIISESIYRSFYSSVSSNALFSAASLGVLIFVIAITFQYLTRKIPTSTEEARAQAQHAAHLQRLAQQIVERMRTGILVFNNNNEIELFNKSAANLLALSTDDANHMHLSDIPVLESKVKKWQKAQSAHTPIVITDKSLSDEVKVNFTQLEPGENSDTLVFVEDNRAITQQAQQLK